MQRRRPAESAGLSDASLFAMNAVLTLLLLCLVQPLAVAAQEIGTLTLVEGPLHVIRGTTVLHGAEGVKLHQGDIIESSNPGFAQLELRGGVVVALGPSTRVFFVSHAAKNTEMFVLGGWLKGEIGPNAGTYRYASPFLAATTTDGTVVLHVLGDGADIFVESGSAGISKVSPEGNMGIAGAARAGQFFSRHAGQGINISPRPSSAFVESMPRPFRDTLPSRLSRVSGKPPEPRRDHEVTYSEIQSWLTIGQSWRKGFMERFQPRLKDAEFRKALESHLKDHPEWDPILHPENHPKTAPAATDNPDREHRR
ncbi:MAG: hypothetical protein ACHP78_15080 [Terriglobales bacterium]